MLILKQVHAAGKAIQYSVFNDGDEAKLVEAIEVRQPIIFRDVPEAYCHTARSVIYECAKLMREGKFQELSI